jgi:hypothetical protein
VCVRQLHSPNLAKFSAKRRESLEGRAPRRPGLLVEVLSPRIPNRGRRVVSPTGATAVTHTIVRAVGATARARCLIFVELAWAVAVSAC